MLATVARQGNCGDPVAVGSLSSFLALFRREGAAQRARSLGAFILLLVRIAALRTMTSGCCRI